MANSFTKTGDYYVSGIDGNDSNAGTADTPFKTISAAVAAVVAAGDTTLKKIIVGTGEYKESVTQSNTSYRINIIGDGNAILNGDGVATNYAFYNLDGGRVENMTIRNFHSVSRSNNASYHVDYVYNCTIINVNSYTGYSNSGTMYFRYCTFIDFPGGASGNAYIKPEDCFFFNSKSSTSTSNYYHQQAVRCIYYNNTTDGSYRAGHHRRGYGFDQCFFQPGATWYDYDSSTTQPVEYYTNRAKELGASSGFYSSQGWRSTVFTMSMNDTLSGSDNLSGEIATFTANNSQYFNSEMLPYNKYIAEKGPTTAFGYNTDSTNILHTDGGATWTNITCSGAGFEISGSNAPLSGSIESAVVDLGSSLPINKIGFNWRSTSLNSLAVSTHPSGAMNHTPVRYQYEMRYGNSTPTGDYKIFELGTQPKIDANGTGSGQPGFDTGSLSGFNARYLQFKITLRTDFSGSL